MAMQETHTTTVDNLFAASQIMPVVADSMMVKTCQGVLKRGALLDKDGTLCKVDSGKTTISAVYAVLAEDVDTASGDKVAAVYLTGEFNEDALSFNAENSAAVADFKPSARQVSIFFKPSI